MSVTSKTATAVIALMLAGGAYPVAAVAQSQEDAVEVEVIEADESAQTTGEAVEESASEAGDVIDQAAEETGEAVDQAVDETAETIEDGAEATGDAMDQAADETGGAIDQATDDTAETEVEGSDTGGDFNQMGASEEVDADTAVSVDTMETDTIESDVEQASDLDPAQQQELDQAAAEGLPVPPTEMLMGVQQDGQWLSSDLIDRDVLNPEGEVIGDIGAILFSDTGPDGVVVEVGGFLGIGQKDVAVKWNELTIAEDGIVLNATEEQLKNAPEFVSLEEQQMESEMQAQEGLVDEDQGMMTSGSAGMVGQDMGTAPATDMQADPEANTVE